MQNQNVKVQQHYLLISIHYSTWAEDIYAWPISILFPLCLHTRSPSDPNHVVYVKLMTSENEKSHGSLILRIGAIFFGLGTLIYAGLEFLTFFEVGLNYRFSKKFPKKFFEQ